MAFAGARSERSAATSRAACCSSLCFGLCDLVIAGLMGLVGALTEAERDLGSACSIPRLARVSSDESRCVPVAAHMQSSRGGEAFHVARRSLSPRLVSRGFAEKPIHALQLQGALRLRR